MRIAALSILLLVTACGKGSQAVNLSNAAGSRDAGTASATPAPTITIAATGCTATWDGQAATVAQIADRSFALLDRAVRDAGGVRNVTPENLPVLTVEAPADLGMSCAEMILFALQRSGMVTAALKLPGSPETVIMDFPLADGGPPPVTPQLLGVGAGGQVTWNSTPIDAAALAAQLGQIGSLQAPESMADTPPPGYPELRVQPEASFGQLMDLLRTTHRYHLRPGVQLPSAAAGPDGSQVANPPPPSPPGAPPPPR